MITGMKKVCKDKAFNSSGCLCILFAHNPEIPSRIQVGKQMEWWIIPKGNLMKVATTGDEMYRRAWKDLPKHAKWIIRTMLPPLAIGKKYDRRRGQHHSLKYVKIKFDTIFSV